MLRRPLSINMMMATFLSVILSISVSTSHLVVQAWTANTAFLASRPFTQQSQQPRFMSSTAMENQSQEDNEEFEYIEYDSLREEDFVGSEWLVGTNWDNAANKIDETWCRLAVSPDGQNLAVWGDGNEGKWSLDVASQFLSISKNQLLGKKIWAGVVDDYYYVQGTVRGWTYWQPASVLAQWQAKRLGVDPEEAGPAPWFEATDEAAPALDEVAPTEAAPTSVEEQ